MTKTLSKTILWTVLFSGALYAADAPERKIVRRAEPEYPTIAARMNLHGTVKLKIWISSDGTVRRLEYIGGHPVLAESALKAVKTWTYQPAAAESTSQIELKF